MAERTCNFIHTELDKEGKACGQPAEWELWPSTARYEFVDSCTDHVGHLLDDAPETVVRPVRAHGGMGGDPGLRKMA